MSQTNIATIQGFFAGDWIHIFTFRDGKVAKFREFMDTAGIADAWRD